MAVLLFQKRHRMQAPEPLAVGAVQQGCSKGSCSRSKDASIRIVRRRTLPAFGPRITRKEVTALKAEADALFAVARTELLWRPTRCSSMRCRPRCFRLPLHPRSVQNRRPGAPETRHNTSAGPALLHCPRRRCAPNRQQPIRRSRRRDKEPPPMSPLREAWRRVRLAALATPGLRVMLLASATTSCTRVPTRPVAWHSRRCWLCFRS
jgi:hypothetical protein